MGKQNDKLFKNIELYEQKEKAKQQESKIYRQKPIKGRGNKENEWQNKQDVATRVKELDLQNKLDTIKRIADYE